jgi:AAA domain
MSAGPSASAAAAAATLAEAIARSAQRTTDDAGVNGCAGDASNGASFDANAADDTPPEHPDGMPPPSEEYQQAHPGWKNRARGTKHGNLTVFSVADLDTAPPRSYLLKGLMSPGELSLWVGPPKCGKSFLMLHVAYLLSLGRPVFGRRVKRTRVLYVAAEGEAGIARRIEALRRRYGDSPDFHWIAQPTDLLHEPGHKADLREAAKACQAELVVLDTINRVLAGGDENSSQDMGALVLYMAELRTETKAHVAAVHHGTKASNGSTPRGHSCLTGADDALIEVTKQEDGVRTARIVHAKDDADGDVFSFRLDRVQLGSDGDGDPIATLIVEEADTPRAPRSNLTGTEGLALRMLDHALTEHGQWAAIGDDGKERRVVNVERWREYFYRDGKPGDSTATKRQAFNRARDSLLQKARIAARDDFVWRPDEAWRQ